MMYQQWSPLRCMVMVTEFCSFLTCILIACAFFTLTRGFSAIFLIKGIHIYGIATGHLNICKCFYWIQVLSTILTTFPTFIVVVVALFVNMEERINVNRVNEPFVGAVDLLIGANVGIWLGATATSILATFWQKLHLTELKHRLTCPEQMVNLKYDA